jgi:tRNA-2-methylthio-N6-dimethylallyladenosine synthase
MAQKDQDAILKRAPYVDVVFGTHNLGSLPALLERARIEEESQIEIKESLEHFPSTLPVRRDNAYSAWVSISVGCNNTCTFCIVPALRGVEKDRTPTEILTEVKTLVDQGVSEITLLGQNVNAYGTSNGERGAFASLLKEVGKISGLERLRFTSPHPRDFTDDVIEVMAQTPNIMPHLHMPLQSGSDKILASMRRSYRSEKYLGILDRVRTAIPNAAITTDIIVGFPGESEEDFQQTYDILEKAQFMTSYIFLYSKRPGTPAATMENQIPEEIKNQRFQVLNRKQQQISAALNQGFVGKEVEILVTARDTDKSDRVSGRAADFRLVHSMVPEGVVVRPGDYLRTKVTHATPNFLIADSEPIQVRKTRGGDVDEARRQEIGPIPLMLGMPKLMDLKERHGK